MSLLSNRGRIPVSGLGLTAYLKADRIKRFGQRLQGWVAAVVDEGLVDGARAEAGLLGEGSGANCLSHLSNSLRDALWVVLLDCSADMGGASLGPI